MLRLTDIRKSYKTSEFTQTALDDVTVSFRDNEFVAVLGPSGSGKTTMLNIIGGLDHYDSGDLEIDGVSTKKYKSHDWDTYRNNRIGFVFQSYNLISHQSVLSNVELALTLSGVSVAERRERAKKALKEVGLSDHIKKKPSQLSGGQMQRVAIARALINDPEILLADEPTGALDTHTSKQVMDLLTQIAKDRLVIMVTHNSELAKQYANRIIHLTDGKITSDTRSPEPGEETRRAARETNKASMSFFTAVALSFSNLMTKKGRTFVTSLAGSIGIIGIAAIIALANGINVYIQTVERETLSLYPLAIQRSGFDFSSFFDDSGGNTREEPREIEPNTVGERRLVQTMFSRRNNNDLASLKVYLDENESRIDPYVNTIQYLYDITPQIYLADTSVGVDQIHPDSILSAYGMGDSGGMGAAIGFGVMPGMNVFHEMPGELKMYKYQYDVVSGRWPENYDEAILVLSSSGRVTDFQLYTMGLRDRMELKGMIEAFMNRTETDVEINGQDGTYSYETLMSATFKVVNPADRYQYDDAYNVWLDKSADMEYMKSLVDAGTTLRIVGIVQPNPSATATSLSSGINYTPGLVSYLMDEATNAKVVRDQFSRPTVNVLSGKTFVQENQESADAAFRFADLISIDENSIRNAFAIDSSKLSIDMSVFEEFSLDGANFQMPDFNLSNLDLSGFDLSNMELPDLDLSNLELPDFDLSALELPDFDIQEMTNAFTGLTNISPEQITGIINEALRDFVFEEENATPIQMAADLAAYMSRPEVQAVIESQLSQIVDTTQIQEQVSAALETYISTIMQATMTQMSNGLQSYLQTVMQTTMTQMTGTLMSQVQDRLQAQLLSQLKPLMGTQLQPLVGTQLEEAMQKAMAELPAQMQDSVSIDQDAFAGAFRINMGEREILDLMSSLMNTEESTYERNLTLLGYADPKIPSQINIYPINFESKQEIQDILEQYNSQMEAEGKPEKVVRYTDIVGTLMSSVTDIVNMVSYALMAFVAISLVVSSIMIGVITYISVLERTKEIGILRAIGASKQNIRRVFNAETLIVGFAAGVLGILVTLLLSILANIIISNAFNIEQIARLPMTAAVGLIAVSMFLTFIAGLIPSAAAARKHPVEALRSE